MYIIEIRTFHKSGGQSLRTIACWEITKGYRSDEAMPVDERQVTKKVA